MKRQLILLLSLFAALFAALGIAACDGEETHHWATEWNHNAQEHWHFCTDEGCNARESFPHEEFVLKEYVEGEEPTCFTRGKGVFACPVCGEEKIETVEATGEHVFDETQPWLQKAEGHYRVCTTRGCRAEFLEPHTEPEYILRTPPNAFRMGRAENVCSICEYVFEEVPVYSDSVPQKFKIGLRREGSGWTSTDLDPVILYEDHEYVQDDKTILQRASVTLAVDNDGAYKYKYYITDAYNFKGNKIYSEIQEFDQSLGGGVSAYWYDENTGSSTELGPNNTYPLLVYFNYFRMQSLGDYSVKFVFRSGDIPVSSFIISVHVVRISEYRRVQQQLHSAAPTSSEIALPPEFYALPTKRI